MPGQDRFIHLISLSPLRPPEQYSPSHLRGVQLSGQVSLFPGDEELGYYQVFEFTRDELDALEGASASCVLRLASIKIAEAVATLNQEWAKSKEKDVAIQE